MPKRLFFICPTDCLEPVINRVFKDENYFCTSLGNSIAFDKDVIEKLEELIFSKDIREISFVLSSDNRIVLDALGNQDFSEVKGLNNFYNQIKRVGKYSEVPTLSYHLNRKIKELKLGLDGLFFDQLIISGKIYNRQENIFNDIYSDLISVEYFSLN